LVDWAVERRNPDFGHRVAPFAMHSSRAELGFQRIRR
jgi:hypothetical protein